MQINKEDIKGHSHVENQQLPEMILDSMEDEKGHMLYNDAGVETAEELNLLRSALNLIRKILLPPSPLPKLLKN